MQVYFHSRHIHLIQPGSVPACEPLHQRPEASRLTHAAQAKFKLGKITARHREKSDRVHLQRKVMGVQKLKKWGTRGLKELLGVAVCECGQPTHRPTRARAMSTTLTLSSQSQQMVRVDMSQDDSRRSSGQRPELALVYVQRTHEASASKHGTQESPTTKWLKMFQTSPDLTIVQLFTQCNATCAHLLSWRIAVESVVQVLRPRHKSALKGASVLLGPSSP